MNETGSEEFGKINKQIKKNLIMCRLSNLPRNDWAKQ